jgi:hypothetical protein
MRSRSEWKWLFALHSTPADRSHRIYSLGSSSSSNGGRVSATSGERNPNA